MGVADGRPVDGFEDGADDDGRDVVGGNVDGIIEGTDDDGSTDGPAVGTKLVVGFAVGALSKRPVDASTQ